MTSVRLGVKGHLCRDTNSVSKGREMGCKDWSGAVGVKLSQKLYYFSPEMMFPPLKRTE
jgi:hypothetical protein